VVKSVVRLLLSLARIFDQPDSHACRVQEMEIYDASCFPHTGLCAESVTYRGKAVDLE
jgi:hypothetical protein